MTKVFRNALYAPLRFPRPYNLLQRFVGASRDRAAFVRTHAVFRPGDKIVDAGCGTGSALEFLPSVTYFGFDPNPDYIRVAQLQIWEPRTLFVRRRQQPTSAAVSAGRRCVPFAGGAPSPERHTDKRNIQPGTSVSASGGSFHFLRALFQRK
jgi:SAM-dependent methyltransferase